MWRARLSARDQPQPYHGLQCTPAHSWMRLLLLACLLAEPTAYVTDGSTMPTPQLAPPPASFPWQAFIKGGIPAKTKIVVVLVSGAGAGLQGRARQRQA